MYQSTVSRYELGEGDEMNVIGVEGIDFRFFLVDGTGHGTSTSKALQKMGGAETNSMKFEDIVES